MRNQIKYITHKKKLYAIVIYKNYKYQKMNFLKKKIDFQIATIRKNEIVKNIIPNYTRRISYTSNFCL